MPFPTEFPQQALTDLIGALSGSSQLSNLELVESAYDLEGYALGMLFENGPSLTALASVPKKLDTVKFLGDVKASAGVGINWQQLLLIAIELVKQFLTASA